MILEMLWGWSKCKIAVQWYTTGLEVNVLLSPEFDLYGRNSSKRATQKRTQKGVADSIKA